jgi:hypothetical protein
MGRGRVTFEGNNDSFIYPPFCLWKAVFASGLGTTDQGEILWAGLALTIAYDVRYCRHQNIPFPVSRVQPGARWPGCCAALCTMPHDWHDQQEPGEK